MEVKWLWGCFYMENWLSGLCARLPLPGYLCLQKAQPAGIGHIIPHPGAATQTSRTVSRKVEIAFNKAAKEKWNSPYFKKSS